MKSTKESDLFLAHNILPCLQTTLRSQIDHLNDNYIVKYAADAHIRTDTGCYSVKVMNRGVNHTTSGRRALYGLSFLQGLTSEISVGGELVAIESKSKQSSKNQITFPVHGTMALQYNDPKYFAMLSYSNTTHQFQNIMQWINDKKSTGAENTGNTTSNASNLTHGLWFIHYLHRVSPNVSLGAELGIESKS